MTTLQSVCHPSIIAPSLFLLTLKPLPQLPRILLPPPVLMAQLDPSIGLPVSTSALRSVNPSPVRVSACLPVPPMEHPVYRAVSMYVKKVMSTILLVVPRNVAKGKFVGMEVLDLKLGMTTVPWCAMMIVASLMTALISVEDSLLRAASVKGSHRTFSCVLPLAAHLKLRHHHLLHHRLSHQLHHQLNQL